MSEQITQSETQWEAVNHPTWGPSVVVKGETRRSLSGKDVPVFVAHGLRSMSLAESIARTHNSHDALVSALERARSRINALLTQMPVRDLAETYAEIDAALQSAKGEQS